MSTSELQNELEQNLALRKEIAQKIRVIIRLIEMLESGKFSSANFYYIPFTGTSIFEGGSVIHPDIRILNRDLAYMIKMLKSIPKDIEELKYEKYKEWTQGEIDRFHQEAKRALNKVANKQRNTSGSQIDKETQTVMDDLINQSNSLIRHLCNILDKEPTKKNMRDVLNEVGHNLIFGGNNTLGLATVEEAVFKRLRWANNNYHPETNPRDINKLVKAYEDACIFLGEHPLITQVEKRLNDLIQSEKRKNRRRANDTF